MPQKIWAIGEEVLAGDFNPFVQQQVVPQFTNPAQRDAQWVSPPRGAMCVTTDTLTAWIHDGAAWLTRDSERIIADMRGTTNLPGFAAETVLTTTPPVQMVAGRSYYWRFVARTGITAAGIITYRLRQTNLAGVVFGTYELYLAGAINLTANAWAPIINPPIGPIAWALTGQSGAGTGTAQGFTTAPWNLQILERIP